MICLRLEVKKKKNANPERSSIACNWYISWDIVVAATGLRLDISIVLRYELKYFQLPVPDFIHYKQVIRT